MTKVEMLKVELFDVLERAAVVLQEAQKLEETKQKKLRDLQVARDEEAKAKAKASPPAPTPPVAPQP